LNNSSIGKPVAGEVLPTFVASTVDGNQIQIGGGGDRWTLLVIYRGKHCGRCKKYLNILESMQGEWNVAGLFPSPANWPNRICAGWACISVTHFPLARLIADLLSLGFFAFGPMAVSCWPLCPTARRRDRNSPNCLMG